MFEGIEQIQSMNTTKVQANTTKVQANTKQIKAKNKTLSNFEDTKQTHTTPFQAENKKQFLVANTKPFQAKQIELFATQKKTTKALSFLY